MNEKEDFAVWRRSVDERLARLRRRLKEARDVDTLRAVMLGLLDLLGDEL